MSRTLFCRGSQAIQGSKSWGVREPNPDVRVARVAWLLSPFLSTSNADFYLRLPWELIKNDSSVLLPHP